MAGAGAGARPAAAYTVMNFTVDIFTVALRVTHRCKFIGSAYESSELVFQDFSLIDRSVTCLKQFVAAYHATHTEGYEMFGYVCLLGICLHWYAITNHLDRNYKAWARTRIFGMAVLAVAGVFLLCLGMIIPKNHAWPWHNTVVHSINILFIFLDAGLLVRSQIKDNVSYKHLLRDLLIVLLETLISIYRFVDSRGKTYSPWDGEKILHLVGTGLPVLIGACQIGWIVYKAGIGSKVVEWLRKMPRVFASEKEEAAGTTMEGDRGGDAGQQLAEESVEVGLPALTRPFQARCIAYMAGIISKLVECLTKITRVLSRQEVPPEEGIEVVVASPV